MWRKMFSTSNDTAVLVMRFALGIVILPHGLQKMFGAFGGFGFSGTMAYFTTQAGIPTIFAFLAIMAEFLGSLGLISGLLTRIAAFGIGVNMVVAIFLVHIHNGFFMNWNGQQAGEGFEYHLLALGLVIALMIKGGGRWSLDRMISEKLAR